MIVLRAVDTERFANILLFLLRRQRPTFRGAQAQAKADDPLEGVWQGYDGELRHVERQLIALAEATPEDKFTWRPAPGVRSTSEVYMHIATANFYLLSITGPKYPDDMKEG